MKTIVQSDYGSADVLQLAEVVKPICDDEGALVKVAASVNAGDWHLMTGNPFFLRLMFGGLLNQSLKLWVSMSLGEWGHLVGKNVTQFCVGNEVFGDISECGLGTFAECICAPATALAPKPAALTHELAAAALAAAVPLCRACAIVVKCVYDKGF